MKKILFIGLTAAMLSPVSFASEVTAGVDTTVFSSGSPALAADVNNNFSALIAAINDNSQRIDALGGAGGSLESKISGATYKIQFVGSILGRFSDTSSGFSDVYMEHYNGLSTVTLNVDHTISENFSEAMREIGFDRTECVDPPDCMQMEFRVEDNTDSDSTVSQGSWSVSGNVLSIMWPGETEADEFFVTGNGEIIVMANGGVNVEVEGNDEHSDFDSSLAIGVRAPDLP